MRYDLVIFSDASTTGWGAVCNKSIANGHWNSFEAKYHINFLELKAVFLALRHFAEDLRDKQILLRVDNITALAYINKMGGIKSQGLNQITREIWEWCKNRKIWIYAEYVASKENPAEGISRISNIDTEWELSADAFKKIKEKFGSPDIDLFASKLNKKCRKYCSWERDPEAFAINALTLNWNDLFWYAFPPFSMINKVIKKIKEDQTEGILVAPFWQAWFPDFKRLIVSDVIEFSPSINLLNSPYRKMSHSLSGQLHLIAAVLSGKQIN